MVSSTGARAIPWAGEDQHVVFDVLPDLHRRRVLEQRLEGGERRFARDLRPHLARELAFGRAVGQRDVTRLAGPDRQRHPHQFGAHGVEARGLGVDGDAPRLPGPRDPLLQLAERADQRIAPLRRRVRRRGGRRGRRGPGVFDADPRQQRAELIGLQERLQRRPLRRERREVLQRFGDGRVVAERDQPAAHAGELGVGDQVLAPLRLRDLPGAGEQRVQVAVGFDELRRGLDADTGNAGDIVGRIPCQRLDVDDLVRGDAEFGGDLGGADLLHAHGVEHRHPAAHQLHQVLVAGDDGHAPAGRRRAPRIGRDQVVGLEAGEFDRRQPERARRVADQRELRDQRLRRVGPVRLVGGVDVVAEGGARGVEQHGDGVAPPRPRQFVDHVAEAEHGVGRRPVAPAQRRQAVEGAEYETRPVDQADAAFAPGVLVHRPLPPRATPAADVLCPAAPARQAARPAPRRAKIAARRRVLR